MATVITISGVEKSGSLARIYALLARKGYGVRGHHASEAPSGQRLLEVVLGHASIDRDLLTTEIQALSAEYRVVSVIAEGSERAEASQKKAAASATAVVKEIAARYPDLVPMVREYAESLDPAARDRDLADAGRRIG